MRNCRWCLTGKEHCGFSFSFPLNYNRLVVKSYNNLLRWKENNFFWYSLLFCFCFTLYKLCGAILVENIDDNFNSSAKFSHLIIKQRAKKVVSDSLGLPDFAIGLVNSVLNSPDGQMMVFEEFKLKKNCEINSACQTAFGAS